MEVFFVALACILENFAVSFGEKVKVGTNLSICKISHRYFANEMEKTYSSKKDLCNALIVSWRS